MKTYSSAQENCAGLALTDNALTKHRVFAEQAPDDEIIEMMPSMNG
jgi:hypothetical protein